MKHWPGSAPSTTPSTATGGVARSIDWSRSSTPAGPRVAAADHLRRPGFAPDLREGHPVCGRRVRRSAATPVRSVSTPAPSALTGALRTGTITFGMWARTTAGSGKSPARWPASVPLRSISYAPMASRTSAKLSISTPSTSYQRPQLRQATRARILMTRTEWPCGDTARQQHPDSPPDLVPDHRRRHSNPSAHHRRGTRLRLYAHGPRDTGHLGDHSPAGMARLLSYDRDWRLLLARHRSRALPHRAR